MTNAKFASNFLGDEKVSKPEFDDLVTALDVLREATPEQKTKLLEWMRYLHSIETAGWRTKESTQRIAKIVSSNDTTRMDMTGFRYYALFCPSYKKGEGVHGFRTDGVGHTTEWGIKTLQDIDLTTRKMGFATQPPVAIFFDLALEQPEHTVNEVEDLEKNIENFKKLLPSSSKMEFHLLSDLFPDLKEIIGYHGVQIDPLPVSREILDRIVERGKKFYERFGWSIEQIVERTATIASSEALVGYALRRHFPNDIMVYTPTMLERAQVYSGQRQNDPLPIIFPSHGES